MKSNSQNWIDAVKEAEEFLNQNQPEKAEEVLSLAIKISPKEMWLYFHHANLASRVRDFDLAIERWKLLIAKFPKRPEGYCELAKLYLNIGNLEESEIAVKEQLKNSFQTTATFLIRYEIRLAQGKNDCAEAELREGLINFPDDYWINYHFSLFVSRNKSKMEALEGWQNFLHKFPDIAEASSEMSGVLISLNRIEEAIAILEELKSKNKLVASGYIRLANAYKVIRHNEKSLEVLSEGQNIFPEDTWIKYHYCISLADNHQIELAIEKLREFCSEHPKMAEAKLHLIEYLIWENRHEDAKNTCNLMQMENPESRLFHKALAKVAELNSEWKAAQYFWHLFDHGLIDAELERRKFENLLKSEIENLDFNVFSYWSSSEFKSLPQPNYMNALLGDRYKVITDEDIQKILEQYPSKYSEMYNRISIAACKSDLARLLYIYQFGGLYLDMHCAIGNFKSFCELENLIGDLEVVFFETLNSNGGFSFSNSIIFAKPGSKPIRRSLENAFELLEIQFNLEAESKTYLPYNIWEISGPKVIKDSVIDGSNNEIFDEFANITHIHRLNKERATEPFDLYHFYSYRKSNNHWTDLQRSKRLFNPN